MGRECRRVPPDWQHPKNDNGRYIPLYDEYYPTALEEWYAGWKSWEEDGSKEHQYWDYEGPPPDPESYRQRFWTDEEATHYMMYEDTTEGTPISPAFATPEELAHWLEDTGASAFGSSTASYESWLRVAKGAWAPSFVITRGWEMVDGVTAAGIEEGKDGE